MPEPELPRPGVDAPSLPGRLVDLVRVEREWHGPLLWQGIGRHEVLWAGTPTGPFADEPEFAADRWAYQTLLKPLGRSPIEAREFLMHLENYAQRNNFEAGRAKPKSEAGRVLFDNHFAAHPRCQKRLRLLKELSEKGATPKPSK